MLQPADRIQLHQDPGQDAKKDPNVMDCNRLSQDCLFQDIGPALHVMQLNVEGLSAAKRDIIASIATKQKVDVICLQETHLDTDKSSQFSICGFDLLSYALHAKHGRATYVRSSLIDCSAISSHPFCDTVRVGDFRIANIYKPPSENWSSSTLPPLLPHPAIYIGDFNSHHPDWGYDAENSDGNQLQG
jgi:hypothetical protein